MRRSTIFHPRLLLKHKEGLAKRSAFENSSFKSRPMFHYRLTGIMAKVKEGAEKAKEELENAKREIEKRAGALDGVAGANGRKDSSGK